MITLCDNVLLCRFIPHPLTFYNLAKRIDKYRVNFHGLTPVALAEYELLARLRRDCFIPRAYARGIAEVE